MRALCRARLLVAVVAWFGFSALCTAGAKAALVHLAPRAGGCALTLTLLQFTFSALVSVTACVLLRRSIPSAPRELLLVSLSYTLGFLLLNCSLGRLQASFSETVRGLEPLTSFALVRLLSHGKPLGRASSAALLAVLGGAALSVWAQPAFDAQGFTCTAAGLQPLSLITAII
jgi:drug/metabolite transporter (DMT)-like permease